MASYTLTINGRRHTVDVDADTPVLWVLRDNIGLTGTKFGCGIGECGACTIHLGDKATRSCGLKVSEVGNAPITTIEALKLENVEVQTEGAKTEQKLQGIGS